MYVCREIAHLLYRLTWYLPGDHSPMIESAAEDGEPQTQLDEADRVRPSNLSERFNLPCGGIQAKNR